MSTVIAFPADGYEARWQTWDGEFDEVLTLRWENEAWTAVGEVGRERVHYVLRISATWEVRQFILFRDLEEPDLWLYSDGTTRWGEMNGAHRIELDGCTDVELACTPFTATVPIRRLGHEDDFTLRSLQIDVETLAVVPVARRYRRIGTGRWAVDDPGEPDRPSEVLEVDRYGLVTDLAGRFRRR